MSRSGPGRPKAVRSAFCLFNHRSFPPARPPVSQRAASAGVSGLLAALAVSLCALVVPAAQGASPADRSLNRAIGAERLGDLRLREPITLEQASPYQIRGKVHPSLRGATGTQEVAIKLRGDSVGRMRQQDRLSRVGQKFQLMAEQAEFLQRCRARADIKVKAQTQLVLNAVFADVDAADLDMLAMDPAVERIVPVANYEMHLSETVPYISAASVQAAGYDGTGIRVAVLDSGVDYTHAALGGPGTVEGYEAAYSDPASRDGLFPTAKVVEGIDLVGETWPDTDLAPDDDPIDFEGHGTHVADIIGGIHGVAPGASIYAVKVCSAVATSCSGIALIQGMEYAVDPNGDGDPEDAVDIINMSLGSDYGKPFDDDLSQAVEAAYELGVVTVSSAGNGADKPYITGTPSSTPAALSVAQTQVPSASLQVISAAGGEYPAVFQPWSTPLTETVSGPLQYGDGAGGNLDGCAAFAPGSLDGLVVLIDRGGCNFTLKVLNVGQAGGVAGIIGLVAPGAPFSGGDGGDRPIDIPGYMISQADSEALMSSPGANVVLDPDNQLPLVGQMVGSSSRGPGHAEAHLIKPEIGAPGASVSAIAGTGSETGAFGGTSGASPMVAGAAALLLEAYPDLSPVEVKARLANTGKVAIDTDPFTGLAPITRIGGGEVRAAKAVKARLAAWDEESGTPALSFGFHDVSRQVAYVERQLKIHNYLKRRRWVRIDVEWRYADDEASGAVTVHAPRWVRVDGESDVVVPVLLEIHGELLAENAMNSGSEGANPDALTFNEFDGYLVLNGHRDRIRVPWQVLPRKASKVASRSLLSFTDGFDQVPVSNYGVGTAQVDGFALLAVSGNLPAGEAGDQSPTPDIRTVGVNTFPVPEGFCLDAPSFVWAFAVNTWERQQHLLPVSHQIFLDTDQDGTDDYVLLNRDASGFGTISDGRQVVYALELETGLASAWFFAEHSMNTGNTVFFVCAEQIGLTEDDMLNTLVDVDVVAQDFYYGGPGDMVEGLTVTPLGEQHLALTEDVPGGESTTFQVLDFGQFPGTSQELGVMLITNGDRGTGFRGGSTEPTELQLMINEAVLSDRMTDLQQLLGRGGPVSSR